MKRILYQFKRFFCILLSLVLLPGADTLTYAASFDANAAAETVVDSAPTDAGRPDNSEFLNTEAADHPESADTGDGNDSGHTDTEYSGDSGHTDTENTGGEPSAPAAATITFAAANHYASVLLKWNALAGAAGYVIERKAENEPAFQKIATVTDGASYTDTNGIAAGCTYTYRIYAYITYLTEDNQTVSINGAYSNTISVKPEFTSTVSSFLAESNEYDSVTLSWRPTDGASGYTIYRSAKPSSGFTKIASVNAPASSYVSGGLTTGKKYYYRIEAFRTTGAFTSTAPVSSTVNATPLPKRPTITATLNSYTSALLKWKKIKGANGYEIYRSKSKNGGYKKIATITKNTGKYTDKNLNTGSTYYYKIKAYRNVKGKKVSGSLSARASVKITLKAPALRSTLVENYNTLTLRWKKVSGADGYYIYRSTKKDGTYKKIATVKGGTTLTYTNTKLSTGKTYYYKIKAYRRSGKKNIDGNYSSVTSKATSLKKVTGVTATPQHANKIKLQWKKVNGASSYNIYRSTSKNGAYTQIKSGVTSASYTDKKLTGGKRYYYKICAKKGSVTGSRSAYASAMASSLNLSQTSVIVQKRFSVTVEGSASPKAKVKWSSANPNIATVSSKGIIKGVGVGNTTIYAKANGVTRSIKVHVRQTLDGIDVSKWQGNIDFHKVRSAGYNFVMIRIYNGIAKDPNFETYYKDAKAAGLGIGVYYYSYATSAAQAAADANTVLHILNGRALNYPVVIDMEDDAQLTGLTNKDRTDIAWAFCNAIHAGGYESGLYANTYWLNNYFENSRLKGMNIWAARWQDISLGHQYSGNGNIFMWQYSNAGNVNGITGNVDLNLGFSD